MNIDQIIHTKKQLDYKLKIALASMERKDDIKQIYNQIRANQENCPHYSKKYNFVWNGDTCPYCGQEHCIRPVEEQK